MVNGGDRGPLDGTGHVVIRCPQTVFRNTEKSFRKIMGYKACGMLDAAKASKGCLGSFTPPPYKPSTTIGTLSGFQRASLSEAFPTR